MEQIEFNNKWMNWIIGCLSSGRASIIVNGSATKEFDIRNGVRQGNPLAHFLFILTMEGFSVTMCLACDQHLFNRIHLPNNGRLLSHHI